MRIGVYHRTGNVAGSRIVLPVPCSFTWATECMFLLLKGNSSDCRLGRFVDGSVSDVVIAAIFVADRRSRYIHHQYQRMTLT